jgi:hypothetical protein
MATEVRNGMSEAPLGDAVWRKSSYSGALGNCVELAELATGDHALRNSRHPAGPALIFTSAGLSAFLRGVERGEFDLRH